MKKILLLLVAVVAAFQFASAAYTNDDLVIETKDGNTVSYHLKDRPVVTFEATDLVLTVSDVAVKYPVADLKGIHFAGEITSVSNVKVSDIAFSVSGSEIAANGLAKGEKLEVYTIDGKAVAASVVDAQGAAAVDISGLSTGVYVIKAGKKAYKIMK